MGAGRFTVRGTAIKLFAVSLIVMGSMTENASALPRNPERPLSEKTCAEAKARYEEALTGSPLVSRERNAELAELARQSMIRLCGEEN